MKATARLAGPPAVLALAATLAMGVALAVLEGTRSLVVNVWLVAIGAAIVWTCWRALEDALPTTEASDFDSVRNRPAEPPTRLRDVVAIEGAILDAEWSWTGVEHRLRPLLRRIAAARLTERHQTDLATEPAAARRILGEELWALVGPGAYGPGEAGGTDAESSESAARSVQATLDRSRSRGGRSGIPRATIKRAIDLLEAL